MSNDFLEIEKFNIEDLDNVAQDVFETAIQRFKELRCMRQSLPDEAYKLKTDFDIEYCRAQTDVCKLAIMHFGEEAKKNARDSAEIDSIKNWQRRREMKEQFVAEQRKLKRPLPWKYDFWGNLSNVIKSVLEFFIPPFLLRIFIRRKPDITEEYVEPEIESMDAAEPEPILLLPYSGNQDAGARVPADAAMTATADAVAVKNQVSKNQTKPQSATRRPAVSVRSLKGESNEK